MGGSPDVVVQGERRMEGVQHYSPPLYPQSVTDVPRYGELRYHNIYAGVDLVFYGPSADGGLKYDWVVAAGVDPSVIGWQYVGVDSVSLLADGQLKVLTPLGSMYEKIPLAYTIEGGGRYP